MNRSPGEQVGDGDDTSREGGNGGDEPRESGDDAIRTPRSDRVLVVDDEPGAAELAATYLERLLEGVETTTANSPDAAMELLGDGAIDCIVSDHDMSGATGLELLKHVREEVGDLPFILFTGKGSEEIASDAISAGVTDYLQKGGGSDGYEMLANRVGNALSRRHVETDLREINRKITAIHGFATEVSSADSIDSVFDRVVDVAEQVLEFDRCVTARRDGEHVYPVSLSEHITSDEVRSFELGEGIAGRTAAEQRTFVIDELDRSDDADPVSDDIGSAISVPIGEYGLIQAVSSRPASFNETDVEFAELVATHAAEAIEQIETERSLRVERDRFAALFDNVPLPVARILVDGDGNQHLDRTNDAFESTFGYTADGNEYQEVRDAVTPERGRRVDPEVLQGETDPVRIEVRRRTVEGIRDFVLHGIPVSRPEGEIVYSVYADIDEQKRVERTLKDLHEATRRMFLGENRERVAHVATRTAIDTLGFPNSGVRLYDADAETLEPTALSEEATDLLGERPPIGPHDGMIWDVFERGEPVVIGDLSIEETAIEYDGLRSLLVVPLGDHGVMPLGSRDPQFFEDRDVQLARVLGANVTAALDRADRIEQLRERDAELQREIDRHEKFAEMVSHDLRNPLTVASGRLELLETHLDADAPRAEIERIRDAHDRMGDLIDDLLTLARHGRTVDDVEPIALAAAAREAWKTVDTGSVGLETPDEDATIDADPERLRTLFENLFRNSVEHGSTSSRAESGADVTVTVGTLEGGFYVADNGCGFEGIDPTEAMEHGVSGAARGSGLGLAIVREIADAHGWETTADDDGGVRFEFRFDG